MNGRRCSIGQTPPPHARWVLDLTPPRHSSETDEVKCYTPGWSAYEVPWSEDDKQNIAEKQMPGPESGPAKLENPQQALSNHGSRSAMKPRIQKTAKRNLSVEYAKRRLQSARRILNKREAELGLRAAADKAKKLSGQNKDRVTLSKEIDRLPARQTPRSRSRGPLQTSLQTSQMERGTRATADKAKELSSQNKDRVTLPKESAVQPLQE
ncbi:hypothetical protein CAEBREN_25067 [Caenorhabditis brenneri]|uniref:Uncharacterized protein n=1 Tax=Caenorhabditis brenneri TaxID=135651 RepID=G0MGU3_CAEBE|nr:hypothetical protein CAEBREN_25067 [Caenorhabditis brenneri]